MFAICLQSINVNSRFNCVTINIIALNVYGFVVNMG
jgi:hypothetical protein